MVDKRLKNDVITKLIAHINNDKIFVDPKGVFMYDEIYEKDKHGKYEFNDKFVLYYSILCPHSKRVLHIIKIESKIYKNRYYS